MKGNQGFSLTLTKNCAKKESLEHQLHRQSFNRWQFYQALPAWEFLELFHVQQCDQPGRRLL
jgi:hypothetical protein